MGVALLCCLAALGGCNNGSIYNAFSAFANTSTSASANAPAPAQTYSLSASISNLSSSGLVLSVDSASVIVPAGASSQTLAGSLATGTAYTVTIQSQPTGQICAVTGGSGTIASSDVTDVVVSCVNETYSVGGSISGLTGGGLVLLDNGGDALTLAANATQFTMNTAVAYGSAYAVTVQTAPTGLVCRVSNGAGTMDAANVTGITIACGPNFTLLYSFAGGGSDGANPHQYSLLQGRDGNFYGATLYGGASNDGTVFEITPAGTETILYSFTGHPSFAGMIQATDGNFYGTTANGGTHTEGAFFRLTPSGIESDLYSFSETVSFGGPYSGVVEGSDGNFYGTTYLGGSSGHGSVFKITSAGVGSTLYSFAGGSDGSEPADVPIQASDVNFYGTTQIGGAAGDGVVFKLTPGGTEMVLYAFTGGTGDGANPYGSLLEGSDGNFYGTTQNGGAGGGGTIYKITPGGVESVVHAFAGGSDDGSDPYAGLILGSDGNFYGMTYTGGAHGDGTVFQLTPGGVETVVHSFSGSDGANPKANLILGSDGNLYGTTFAGGTDNYGTFFEIALH